MPRPDDFVLTKRDEFAKAALTGAVIATFAERPAARPNANVLAELCYKYADAMMLVSGPTEDAPVNPENKPES
jgi:hypothetical protein